MTRDDPIRKKHYKPLEIADFLSSALFYVGAGLSFFPLLVDKAAHPAIYSGSLTAFVLVAAAIFVLSVATRLYFFPRAEDARRKEFLSNAFGLDLIHQRTTGYYNNPETEPLKRIGLMVLENLFFTGHILREMAPAARTKAGIYLAIWVTVLLWRDTPLDWIAAMAQIVLSEEVLARWLRVEWGRSRAERLYEAAHRTMQSDVPPEKLKAYILETFGEYETGKAVAGVLLSQKVFDRVNPTLTVEWEQVKAGLAALHP